MAKIFLAISGQAPRPHADDLEAFICGFNSNGVLATSIAGVAPMESVADEAIKGHLPFFLSACDFVLLGSTQEGAYATDLLRLDPITLQEKVLLVRTPRCAVRILELELQEIQLPGLFDEEAKVLETKPASSTVSPQPFTFTFGAANPSLPIAQVFGTPSPALSRTSALAPPSSSPTKLPSLAASQTAFSDGFFTDCAPSQLPSATELPLAALSASVPARQSATILSANSVLPAATPAQDVSPKAAAHYTLALPPGTPSLTPPLPASSSSPASPSSPERRPRKEDTDAYFRPLLSILRLFHDHQEQPRPRRADVGQRLKQRFPEFKNKSFGEYAKEAEKKGLVVLGKGEKLGSEWIARKGQEGVGEDLAGMMDELSLLPSEKAAFQAAPAAPAPPPPSPPAPHPYQFLLTFLLAQSVSGKPRSLRSFVGDQLRKANLEAGPGKWLFDQASKEGLREYLANAEEEGWIRSGRGEGVGAEWVELVDIDKTKAYLAAPPPQPEPVTAPPSPVITGTTRPIPSHILPLLHAIDTCRPPIRWTNIGAMLNRYKPRLYEEGQFKVYVAQAEKDKWIETWKVEEKEGMYGMKMTDSAAKAFAARSATSTSSSPSTSTNPARQRTYSTFDGNLPSKFEPLVAAIRAQSVSAPHWTNIGGVLNRIKPRVYEEGEFKAYIMEAVKTGIIRTGRVEDKENMYWMRLTPAMAEVEVGDFALPSSSNGAEDKAFRPPPDRAGATSSSTADYEIDSSTVPVSDHVPSRFLPLMRAIVSVPFPRPFYSQVGAELGKMHPKSFGPHAESATVREYIEEAVLLGLVDRGKGPKTGQDWIQIKTGLPLPADLQALRNDMTASRAAPTPAHAPPVGSFSLFPPLPGSAPPAPIITTSPVPPPAFSPSPVISSTPSRSLFPSAPSASGPVRVPPDVIARWRPLAAFDPFAPLVITLRYLLDEHHDPSPSLSKLRSVLEQFPAESLPGGGSNLERVIRAGGGAEGEELFGYVAKAQREGVVQIGAEGVALKEPWTTLEGLS
ncbi:hypothetical protein JCM11251_004794 [Rhodosporidiobolus azoricus]